jgi:iron complex transport system ATP-binding protein
MNSIAIHARSVCAKQGNDQVLHGVTVAFGRGRWTSIVGPNGAGKSTLLKVLAGLHAHTGHVELLGMPLHGMPARERARRMAWLGQGEGHTDDLSAYDVAMLGRLPHQTWLAPPSDSDRNAVEDALQATQSWCLRDRSIGALSGGERQRVLLARALAVQADVLLMDEPLANMDPPHQSDWLQMVRTLIQNGKTVISVLHEVSMALHSDDIVILERGHMVHQGACADAESHRALERVFQQRIRVCRFEEQWIVLPQTDSGV